MQQNVTEIWLVMGKFMGICCFSMFRDYENMKGGLSLNKIAKEKLLHTPDLSKTYLAFTIT